MTPNLIAFAGIVVGFLLLIIYVLVQRWAPDASQQERDGWEDHIWFKQRWLIVPGPVISRNDRQRHFITGAMLINLYDLRDPDTYMVAEPGTRLYDRALARGLTPLPPRWDGEYLLPDGSPNTRIATLTSGGVISRSRVIRN